MGETSSIGRTTDGTLELARVIEHGRAVSIPQLAHMFGLIKGVIRKSFINGDLPAFRVGELWRVRPENIPAPVIAKWLRRPVLREGELPEGSVVYFIQGVADYVKIGFSTNLKSRWDGIQCGCPVPIRLRAFAYGTMALERQYHKRFYEHRQTGEWFVLCPEIEAEIQRLSDLPKTHRGHTHETR